MGVTSELNTNPGLCAFVCLYPRNLDEMGFLTEFHLILDGIASITDVDPESECVPCIYPNKSNLDRRPDMDCSHCARYSRRSNDGGVLKVRVDLPLGKKESASWGRSISDY